MFGLRHARSGGCVPRIGSQHRPGSTVTQPFAVRFQEVTARGQGRLVERQGQDKGILSGKRSQGELSCERLAEVVRLRAAIES